MKIGIGITTHNRPAFLAKCLENIRKYTPDAEIVVVDDASNQPVPEATFRFNENVGIARAKNKALELLYKKRCDHYFLFDDDCWPVVNGWYTPYIESVEPHLMYIFKDFSSGQSLSDTIVLYKDSEKIAYSHPRGCMLYFKKECLERVGGMDTAFKRWGYEHVNLSDRIFMAGLTSFRYMDVPGSAKLIHSDDEHNENRNTTVAGMQRYDYIRVNKPYYESKKYSDEFIPFFDKENIFLTCYFTNIPDTQQRQWTNTLEPLMPLIGSVKQSRLVVLHDCFTSDQIATLSGRNVTFLKVETAINPYFQRWVSYRAFLNENKAFLDHVFCIDATDTEILKEPIWSDINGLYTGDEPDMLNDSAGWMVKYHPILADWLQKEGKRYQLLNAGVLGGDVNELVEFMRAIIDFYCLNQHLHETKNLPSAGMTDMAAFNYIARTLFNDQLRYGREITTTFKANERNNYSFIKHK